MKGKHIITSPIEHSAVLESVEYLQKNGFDIDFVKVDSNGRVDVESLKNMIKKDTILISIMWVNNETGVIQPIQEISKIARKHNIIFHSDAVQALGKLKLDASWVDILSASAHKFYGPKGVGFMYKVLLEWPRHWNCVIEILKKNMRHLKSGKTR